MLQKINIFMELINILWTVHISLFLVKTTIVVSRNFFHSSANQNLLHHMADILDWNDKYLIQGPTPDSPICKHRVQIISYYILFSQKPWSIISVVYTLLKCWQTSKSKNNFVSIYKKWFGTGHEKKSMWLSGKQTYKGE